ncbi:hypothetical protein [Haloplanus salilacus]|uniref:hypothetical protein n=1 Tax=Haloplanus salilacus TaxID=2949994 RepID=UPI0030CC4F6A
MSVDDAVRRLHDHLEATEELPVTPAAGRWLGEAAAVAGDLVDADLPETVVADRVERVVALLDEVEQTGNEAVDDHVAAAERAAEDVLASADGE